MSSVTNKPQPIRIGDRFQSDGSPRVWAVIRTRPGGVVEMMAEDRALFCERYTREVREMKRLEGKNEDAIRKAQYLNN